MLIKKNKNRGSFCVMPKFDLAQKNVHKNKEKNDITKKFMNLV